MVYIFESTIHMNQEEKLEQVRQQLIDQIRDGVVLLPANMRLKEVVNTPMGYGYFGECGNEEMMR